MKSTCRCVAPVTMSYIVFNRCLPQRQSLLAHGFGRSGSLLRRFTDHSSMRLHTNHNTITKPKSSLPGVYRSIRHNSSKPRLWGYRLSADPRRISHFPPHLLHIHSVNPLIPPVRDHNLQTPQSLPYLAPPSLIPHPPPFIHLVRRQPSLLPSIRIETRGQSRQRRGSMTGQFRIRQWNGRGSMARGSGFVYRSRTGFEGIRSGLVTWNSVN